jgi:hypothetical protein
MLDETEKPEYAILRVEKVKSLRELQARADHNNRKAAQGLEHTNPEGEVVLLLGDDDAVAAWHRKAQAVGVSQDKLRKDATYAVEWLATASPEWWAKATDEEKAEWQEATMAFIIEKAGGPENVLSMHLHMDESTPHIQGLTIPLIEKEIKQKGRAKKGKEKPPAEVAWTLSAADYIGGHRNRLIEMQSAYAAEVAHLGLRRGVPRKETGARNMPPAKWRAAMAIELDAQREATAEAQEARQKATDEANVIMAKAHQESARVITTADERAEALHLGFQAVEVGQLAYSPDNEAKGALPLTLRNLPPEKRVIAHEKQAFQGWVNAARPYFDSLVGYAKRLWGLEQREAQVEAKEGAITGREAAIEAREGDLSAYISAIKSKPVQDEIARQVALEKRKNRRADEGR